MLAEEEVSTIDVHLDSEAPRTIPANQTYPVSGLFAPSTDDDAERSGEPGVYELSLDIRDGLLGSINLYSVDADLDAEVAAMTADHLGASAPGTFHPEASQAGSRPSTSTRTRSISLRSPPIRRSPSPTGRRLPTSPSAPTVREESGNKDGRTPLYLS